MCLVASATWNNAPQCPQLQLLFCWVFWHALTIQCTLRTHTHTHTAHTAHRHSERHWASMLCTQCAATFLHQIYMQCMHTSKWSKASNCCINLTDDHTTCYAQCALHHSASVHHNKLIVSRWLYAELRIVMRLMRCVVPVTCTIVWKPKNDHSKLRNTFSSWLPSGVIR